MTDNRRFRAATQRNREPILAVLRDVLPETGTLLELASGSGEHAVFFAGQFPGLEWQPTDPSEEARDSIAAWIASQGAGNVRPPLDLDVTSPDWGIGTADAALCVNLIHISPWAATEGLMRGAGRVLSQGAPLILYGPYKRGDRPLEPGNIAFDEKLRAEDPSWGLRDLDDVAASADANGLALDSVIEMPANNLSVIFRKC